MSRECLLLFYNNFIFCMFVLLHIRGLPRVFLLSQNFVAALSVTTPQFLPVSIPSFVNCPSFTSIQQYWFYVAFQYSFIRF